MSPSTTLSSTPVTVTVWGLFQFPLLKLREFVDNLPSLLSSPVMGMVTWFSGWAVRATVKLMEAPFSLVVVLLVTNVIPAVSSSVLVMVRFSTATFL